MILKVRIACDTCGKPVDIDNAETRWNFSRILRSLADKGWSVTIGTMQSRQVCPACKQPDEFDKCA